PHQCPPSAPPAAAGGPAEADGADDLRSPHRLLPHRGTAWSGPTVADLEGEAAPVAVPSLRAAVKEDSAMTLKTCLIAVLAVAVGAGPLPLAAFGQAKEVFIPLLVYRTGPYAPSGIPIANGFADYFTLLDERDGGINGVKVTWEECETQYDTKQGVECYERLKG